MFHRFRLFFESQKTFALLSIFFGAYLGVFILHHFINSPVISILQIVGGLFFMILGTGIGIALILQWLLKKDLNRWEFLSFSLLCGMLVPPSVLTAEFFLLNKAYDWYPIANSIVFWCGAGILLFFKKTSIPPISYTPKSILKHPLFVVLVFASILTLIQVSIYRTLPDLDPYKWFLKYTYQFANQQLDYTERPLFGSLIFIGTRFMGLDIFNFFKYAFPFIFLVTFFPAWMVARTFAEIKKQWLFLLFVFISPLVFLYAETPMPQSLLITLSYFFVFFLLYSFEKDDSFYLYTAGIAMFLAFFYHQAAIIIFAIWAVITIFAKRAIIFSDKKTLFLISLLIATNLSFFEKMRQFLESWTSVVISRIFSANNLNLLYPAYYTNIDRNVMGWGSLSGVIKFYAFNIGPLLGGVLIIFLGMLLFNSEFRSFVMRKIATQAALSIVALVFFLFFAIAEILPRFPNVALLPDRAWIFAGIFTFIIFFMILRFVKKIPSWSIVLFSFFLLISVSGALYVNYLKRYLITPAQWQSAQWIKTNLPKNRIFLSYGHKALLPFHADSTLRRIPATLYCSNDIRDFQIAMNNEDSRINILETNYVPFLKTAEEALQNASYYYADAKTISEKYLNAVSSTDALAQAAAATLSELDETSISSIIYPFSAVPVLSSPIPVEDVYEQKKFISMESMKKNPLYIYYGRQHALNPYRARPYEMQTWGIDPCSDGKFLFDLYPDKFKRIYQVNNEEVIIWKVL